MSQPRYLMYAPRYKEPVQVDQLRVRHPENTRLEKKTWGGHEVVGLGTYDRKQLRIQFWGEHFLRPSGKRAGVSSDHHVIERTAAAIKKVVRRLRPEEAAVLEIIDDEIALHEAELLRLRAHREATVKDAWKRAHVVRLAELEEILELPPQ